MPKSQLEVKPMKLRMIRSISDAVLQPALAVGAGIVAGVLAA